MKHKALIFGSVLAASLVIVSPAQAHDDYDYPLGLMSGVLLGIYLDDHNHDHYYYRDHGRPIYHHREYRRNDSHGYQYRDRYKHNYGHDRDWGHHDRGRDRRW
jgi:hypothetical protein